MKYPTLESEETHDEYAQEINSPADNEENGAEFSQEGCAQNNEENDKIPENGKDDDEISQKAEEIKNALDEWEHRESNRSSAAKKPEKKHSFIYPKNSVMAAFVCLIGFAVILAILSAVFFGVDLDGNQVIFGVAFTIFAAAVTGIALIYYLPAALELNKLLGGKGVRMRYKLKNYEVIDLAEQAKNKNRGFYLAVSLFGLAFSIYYIVILSQAIVKTNLMYASLIFSACVFVFFALLFFFVPKYNYNRMMESGNIVIIGVKSVYFGGIYYHWHKVNPAATEANMDKKHRLEITFAREFKNGKIKKEKVTVYVPEREMETAQKLLEEYKKSYQKYSQEQKKHSILN